MVQNERCLFYDTSKSNLYLYNNKIYKMFKGLVLEDLETQLYYNLAIKEDLDRRIVMPNALIPDEHGIVIGYIMDYIKGETISKKILHDDLDFYDKTRIINDFFYLLKQVHEYLTVGDIRNSNLMIGEDRNAYMIDFDFAVRNTLSKNPTVCYQLFNNEECLDDKNGDIIKMFISALSLLYDFDLEKEIKRYSDVNHIKNFIPYGGILKDYYEYFINQINHHEPIKEYLSIPLEENVEKDIMIKKRSLLD